MELKFNIYVLPQLFVSLCTFAFGLFVFSRNRKSSVNRSFLFLALTISLWKFTHFILYPLADPNAALLWGKSTFVLIALIASAIYQFVISFLKIRERWSLYLCYALSLFLIYLAQREDFIVSLTKYPWGNYPQVGPGHNPYLAIWATMLLISLLRLFIKLRQTESPYVKKRIKFLLITLSIAYLGAIDYLPCYGINIYPLGFIPILFFIGSMAYAIVRYRLMDIEFIVTKVSIVGFVFISAVTLLYFVTLNLQPSVSNIFGKNWVVLPISVSFLVSYGLFKFTRFVRKIEEIELSKKFPYRSILKKEAGRISMAKSINELLAYVVRDLSCSVRLDHVGIFIWDNDNREFVLTKKINRVRKNLNLSSGLALPQDNPLIIELLRRKKPLVASEIEFEIENRKIPPEERDFLFKIIKVMEDLGAEMSIPCLCEDRILAIVNIGHKLNIDEIVTEQDLELFFSLSSNIARTIHDFMLKEEKIKLIVASQNILIEAIEAKDRYTRGHTDRVADYCVLLGQSLEKQLRAFPNSLSSLKWAAQLHDIGKIGISDNILLKPSLLDEKEWEMVKKHPLNGLKIVDPMREWLGEDICAGILHHHENYDGTGYPSHQEGENIHFFARIIRVVDSFDAMTTDRPYRRALSKKEAMKELKTYKGTFYDPQIVEAMEELYSTEEI